MYIMKKEANRMVKSRTAVAAALILALIVTASILFAQVVRVQKTGKVVNRAQVLNASKLGSLKITKARGVKINSLCDVNGKMYGAGPNKVYLIGEDGKIKKTIPTKIKSPTISRMNESSMIIGDTNTKLIYRLNVNTGKEKLILNLNKVRDTRSSNYPNASLLKQNKLACVASDGKNVYAGVAAGFSSAVFKINPKTNKILSRGFSGGPDPSAMLFHGGKLLVLDRKGKQIRQFDQAVNPSRKLTKVQAKNPKGIAVINNEIRVLAPGNNIVKMKVNISKLLQPSKRIVAINPRLKIKIKLIDFPQKYAVLICGDIAENFWGECFWNDTVWMYKTLRNAGYSKENIYVLYGYGADYASANPRYQSSETVTDFPATVSWVNKMFDGLKNGDAASGIKKMTSNDTLFVWTFDHGGGGSTAYLCLWDGAIYDTSFASKLNAITYQKRAIFMQQCRSGGFIDNLRNNKTFISTACRATENAQPADTENEVYGGNDYSHGEYNYYIISALRGLTPMGAAVNADANSSGKVSAREAHTWEKNHESRAEIPQMNDMGSIGSSFFIN